MSILSQLTGAQETGKWYTFQEFGVVESELTDKTNMPIILVQFDRSYHDKPMQFDRKSIRAQSIQQYFRSYAIGRTNLCSYPE